MTDITPPLGVDPKTFMTWGRWVVQKIKDHEAKLDRVSSASLETSRSLTGATTSRIAKLGDVIAQQQAQIDYQASLITVAAQTDSFNSGNIPPTSSTEWLTTTESLSLTITLAVPTGRLLLSYGCSEMSVTSGSGAAIGYMGYDLNDDLPGSTCRVYVGLPNQYLGAGTSRQRVVNVTPGTLTVRARFAGWSTATTGTAATIQFNAPWMSAQVLPVAG